MAGSRAREASTEDTDVLVVGSGFGGSVAAYRLADAGKQVVLLERGRPYPPGSFARTPAQLSRAFWDPSEGLYGLFDAWTMRGLEGLVSSGLGGGSLIYANVLLRKDEHWFVHDSPLPGGGYENWAFSRADLDPHYARVERMIGTSPYPYQDTAKTRAFEAAARSAGHRPFRPPLAVSFAADAHSVPAAGRELAPGPYPNLHGAIRQTCTLCGECDLGCNTGAKNTLDHTYLSAATATGRAELRTLHEVRGFKPESDGRWLVRYVVHDPQQPQPTAALPEHLIRCRKLVLAAGSFATSWLLLRNRASLPGISPRLGTGFCGNGDLLGLALNATENRHGERVPRSLDAGHGPVITTTIRGADTADGTPGAGRGFYLQDAGYPGFVNWLMEASQVRSALPRVARLSARLIGNRLFMGHRSNISADLAAALGPGVFSDTSLPLLGMGRDVPDGRMFLRQGRLAIDWTVASSEDYFNRVREAMTGLAGQLGADFQDNPLWWAKRVITVHPLGGAPIGATSDQGVCDPFNQVFGLPGLYVVDGAAMPGPVGANPALTIAALSDRACERMLERWDSDTSRVHPSPHPGPDPDTDVDVDPNSDPGTSPTTEATASSLSGRRGFPGHRKPTGARPAVSDSPRTVAFTEQMKGYFTLGVGDPVRAVQVARLRDQRMMFELVIDTGPLERFLSDPAHPGTATGFVDADQLGGRAEVERGWFNLFVPVSARRRLMLYRLQLTSPGGRELTLVGYKDIHDDPGLDPWADTTTLYVQVLDGFITPLQQMAGPGTGLLPADDARVLGAGVLRIRPLDFAHQLTTFRTTGPRSAASLADFGRLFLGSLYRSYLRPGLAKVEP